MSNKSTADRYDNEGDTDSHTTYSRECCSSPKSTFSSSKDESLAGPSGDFECCSTCSSPLSSNQSSSYRSSLRIDDIDREAREIFQSNFMYLDRLRMHRRQLNLADLPEASHNSKLKSLDPRRFNSAPAYCSKRISNSCTLQSIEENDEHTCSTNSSASLRNEKIEKNETTLESQSEVRNTPRFYEVPPKKVCLRENTPEMDPCKVETLADFSMQINECCQKQNNKRFTIGDKEFILRKVVNNGAISTVSTQVSQTIINNLCEDYCNKSSPCTTVSHSFDSNNSSVTSNRTAVRETSNVIGVSLPQSVIDEKDVQKVALEPNIIIIDRDENLQKYKRKRIDSIGDVSTDSDDLSSKSCYIKGDNVSGNNSAKHLNKFVRHFMGTPRESKNTTPTYVMSTNYSDSTLQDTARNSKNSETPSALKKPVRYYSTTEVVEREIRTIDRDSLEIIRTDNSVEPTICVTNLKSLLGDFSSGVQPTRPYPVHFDDIEKLERQDRDNEAKSFKEKASELLKCASSGLDHLNRRPIDEIKIGCLSGTTRKSEDSKNTSLIDLRKNQTTDLNYYLVGSSSEESIYSEGRSENTISGVNPIDIQIESDDENHCCGCFGSLKIL